MNKTMAFIPPTPLSNCLIKVRPTTTHTCRSMHMSLSRRSFISLATIISPALVANPAFADHTLVAAKRAYDRYYPRIVEGVEKTKTIGSLIKDDASIDEIVTDKVFDIKLRRAMSIYATSFSDNYLGERSRDMLKCVDRFYGELAKAREGTERKEHYNSAVVALVTYFEIARLDKTVVRGLDI